MMTTETQSGIPLEKVLRRKTVDMLKKYDLYYESKPPTGMGASGLDLSVNLRGRWLSLEIKRSPKHHMTPRQAATAREVMRTGGMFMLIQSEEDLDRLREIIEIQLHGEPEQRLNLRDSLMERFDSYLMATFRAHAERIAEEKRQQMAMDRDQQLAELRAEYRRLVERQALQPIQSATSTWTSLSSGLRSLPLGGYASQFGTTATTETLTLNTMGWKTNSD